MVLRYLLLSGLIFGGVWAACFVNKDCGKCIQDKESFFDVFGCRWCPLTRSCHAFGSVKNSCADKHQVTEDNEKTCDSVEEPPVTLPYDPYMAQILAKWCSLSYVQPELKDEDSIKSVVASQIGSSYRVLEYIYSNCSLLLNSGDCASVVGISDTGDHLVVAFRGTFYPEQWVEQIVGSLTGMEDFAIGGEVLRYNGHAHEQMYPCVKSIVQEQLNKNPNLRVSITGHSLGGSHATLTASHLIFDGVVAQSKLDLYTFGAPRVGDRDFADAFDRIVANSWRVTIKKDPYPQVVPHKLLTVFFAFHSKREVFYDTTDQTTPTSSYRICLGNEDKSCLRDEPLCLSDACRFQHGNYLVPDLPRYIDPMISTGTAAPTASRGQCKIYVLSS